MGDGSGEGEATVGAVERPSRRSIGARRSPATEAAVVGAVRALLGESGAGAVTFEAVARRAKAGKPTLYRWWPTKTELLAAAFLAEPRRRPLEPDTGRAAKDLATYTRALFETWRNSIAGAALAGLFAEAGAGEGGRALLCERVLPDESRPVRAILGRAASRCEVEPGDVELATEIYLAFVLHRLLTGRIDDDRVGIDRMARFVTSGRGRK